MGIFKRVIVSMRGLSDNKRKMMRFAGFIVCVLLICQVIFPVFESNSMQQGVSNEYDRFGKDTFDVILAGSSTIMYGIHPLQLYDEFGISSYSLTTAAQRIPLTYYLVKEALREQHPQLVVIDVYYAGYEQTTSFDGHTHLVTDALSFPEKLACVTDVVPQQKQADFLFEFGTYHTRWENLSKADFYGNPNRRGTYGAKAWYGSIPFDSFGPVIETRAPLPENADKYLRKTIEMCQENGVEVLLTLMPMDYNKVVENGGIDRAEWQKYWNGVQDIADEYGINYLNFMHCYDELQFDPADSTDGGTHLNAYSAETITRYLGEYLKENYTLEDVRENPSYDFMREDFERYQEYKTELELMSTKDLGDYLDLLKNYRSSRYTIFVSVKDIQGYALTQDIIEKMINLGYEGGGILLDKQYHSFIGMIHGAKVVEMYGGNEALFYDGEINRRKVFLSSRTLEQGNLSEIKIGAKDYSVNKRGLNFVLYDNQAEEVIDAVSFDTHVPEFTCSR